MLVAAVLLIAASAPDDEAKKDLALMQGTWTVIDGQVDGQVLDPADKKKAKVIIKADRISISGVLDYPASTAVKLNPTKTPKEIDLLPQAAPLKGKVSLGIYAVEENSLKLCLNVYTTDNDRGEQRPADFVARTGSSRVVLVLKKGK
jgi:uncharacterized protein (TIGR03067 family)